ncbi:MAG: nucleotide exchange factor GrpE [Verrucomicrobiae bacterium]|nr:nucleotide exchange factor GrpE [Verrucomicrobiae bacterium]
MKNKPNHNPKPKMNEEIVETSQDAELSRRGLDGPAAESPSDPENPPSSPISTGEIEALQKKAADADKYYDLLLRTRADLENFKKRAAREREDIVKRANENLLRDLLSVLDHFELGLQSSRDGGDSKALLEGMEMVHGQLIRFLKNLGVEPIEAVGQEFDPAVHEAIAQQPSDVPAGQVIAQTRKGYKLRDMLLRPAAVVVSKGP